MKQAKFDKCLYVCNLVWVVLCCVYSVGVVWRWCCSSCSERVCPSSLCPHPSSDSSSPPSTPQAFQWQRSTVLYQVCTPKHRTEHPHTAQEHPNTKSYHFKNSFLAIMNAVKFQLGEARCNFLEKV